MTAKMGNQHVLYRLPLVTTLWALATILVFPTAAHAITQGDEIVKAAASQAGIPYCLGGGNQYGPTACGGMPKTFDCTGLTMYAVFQVTGTVLSHDGHQATEGGQIIHNESELKPGDLVFFGGTLSNFEHAGVYAGGGKIWDALNYGIPVQQHTFSQVGLPFVGAARYWHAESSHNPIGSYDLGKSPSAGEVRIGGWAFDPDAKTTPITIHAYVGAPAGQPGAEGHNLGLANRERADVGRAYPGVGNFHGFDFTFETSKRGSQPVCVYAINIGAGGNTLLGCKTVSIGDPNPLGHLDLVESLTPGSMRIGGWAFDPNALTSPLTIHAYVGAPAGQPGAEGHNLGLANRERADVGRAYPGVGNFHGFDFTFETKRDGNVPVCVYAINAGPGTNVLLACGTVTIAAKQTETESSGGRSGRHRHHHRRHRHHGHRRHGRQKHRHQRSAS